MYVQRNGYQTFNRYQTAWGGVGFVSVHVLAISPECETAFENAECGIALYRIWNRRFDVYAVRISVSYTHLDVYKRQDYGSVQTILLS